MFTIFEQETSQNTIDYHTVSPLIYHPLKKHPNNFLTDIHTTPTQTPHNLSDRGPTKLDNPKRLFNAIQTVYGKSVPETYIYPLRAVPCTSQICTSKRTCDSWRFIPDRVH